MVIVLLDIQNRNFVLIFFKSPIVLSDIANVEKKIDRLDSPKFFFKSFAQMTTGFAEKNKIHSLPEIQK